MKGKKKKRTTVKTLTCQNSLFIIPEVWKKLQYLMESPTVQYFFILHFNKNNVCCDVYHFVQTKFNILYTVLLLLAFLVCSTSCLLLCTLHASPEVLIHVFADVVDPGLLYTFKADTNTCCFLGHQQKSDHNSAKRA